MVEYVVYDAKTLEKARKKAGRREWIHDKYQKIVNGVMSNKEFFMIVVPIGTATIGAVAKGAKAIGKKQTLKKEQDLKELYCYDRSLGHYWKLRRELTNAEWVEIDKRKKRGERLADILSELKVLK